MEPRPDGAFDHPNLALNRPALQSSTSPWSRHPAPEDDAHGANDGDLSGDLGFHTATERDPWWQVDLGDDFLIREVVLFNRRHMAHRLRRFSLLGSLDGVNWTTFFRKMDSAIFGDADDAPYVARIAGDHLARFVRVRLDGYDCLHFRECQVFGEEPDAETKERIREQQTRLERARLAIPEGRAGHLASIDGFRVFVDTANYDPSIVFQLDHGGYEGRERYLATELLRPGDRVLEIGTAIGLVSMTAAAIVGPSSVLTFEANQDIAEDARANFWRNGLGGIQSRVGVLKNRARLTPGVDAVDFHVATAFWASRLDAAPGDPGIAKVVKVPVFRLEDEIRAHSANVLICDIEGGEVDLLMEADLSGIRLIIMETHYWAAGEASTDALVRKLILDGFSVHLNHSAYHILALRREP